MKFIFNHKRFKPKYYFILGLIFIFLKGISQNDSVSYWVKQYETETTDLKKLDLLSKISGKLCQLDSKRSIQYSNMEEELALKLKNKSKLTDAYLNKAIAYRELSKNEEALNYNLKALRTAEDNRDTFFIAKSNNILAVFYHVNNSFEQAEKYYLSSFDMFVALKDARSQAIVYNNLSDIYSKTNRKKLAEEALNKSIIARKKSGNIRSIGIGYYSLAYYLAAIENYSRSLIVADSAMVYIKEAEDDLYYSQLLVLKGEDLTKMKKFEQSNKILLDMLNNNVLFENKLDMIDGIYSNISTNYEGLNNPAEALRFSRLERSVADSIYRLDNLTSLAEAQTKFDSEKQTRQIEKLNSEKKINALELNRQKTIRNAFLAGSLIFLIFSALIFRSLQLNRKSKKVIELQKEELEIKNKEVTDSIHYAQRIQSALMSHAGLLKANIKEHFILFKPKDIVSGDFYWATKKDNRLYIAVCDSTGHGVPGAFMSLLNINFLNEAINEKNISQPNAIFNYVRKKLIENISQDGAQDGMDGILICITLENGITKLTYSAANNNPLLYSENKLIDLPTDKMPVGKGEKTEDFKLYEVENCAGSTIYLYTDGYADQFGGPKGKKFKDKNLNSLINSIALLPLGEQKEKLEFTFHSWKNSLEQVDDVCVVGIKL